MELRSIVEASNLYNIFSLKFGKHTGNCYLCIVIFACGVGDIVSCSYGLCNTVKEEVVLYFDTRPPAFCEELPGFSLIWLHALRQTLHISGAAGKSRWTGCKCPRQQKSLQISATRKIPAHVRSPAHVRDFANVAANVCESGCKYPRPCECRKFCKYSRQKSGGECLRRSGGGSARLAGSGHEKGREISRP